MHLYDYKVAPSDEFELLYVNNFYTIADSLTYPLYMSAILKTDDKEEINRKITIVAQYIDRLANIRTLSHRSITQSSIRNLIYENVKGIRSLNSSDLKRYFNDEIDRSLSGREIVERLQQMNNWGYFHYFFARILYCLSDGEQDFKELLRSRKQSSYVLFQIFRDEDLDPDENPAVVAYLNSVANFCLVRRKDANDFDAMDNNTRLKAVLQGGYLPEMEGDFNDCSMTEFIQERDKVIAGITEKIWGKQ